MQPSGLSRYFDLGEGPAPEVVAGERDEHGQNHYDRVRAYFRTHAVPDYPIDAFYDRGHNPEGPIGFGGQRAR